MFYNFDKDLEQSNEDVKKVIAILRSKGATNIDTCDNKDYDVSFIMNDKYYNMEIKHDYLYNKTGNVAIEIQSRGKSSGIITSKASIWCYILDEFVYVVSSSKLKKFLSTSNYKIVNGGDDYTSKLILVPLVDFKKIFIEI